MNRLLTTFLVLLALTGVVSGNLLRPCDCTASEEIDARALCRSSILQVKASPSCCGGCQHEAPGDEDSDEEGCTLCCKPRPPLTEAAGTLTLADVQAVVAAVLDERTSTVAVPANTTAWSLTHERRTSDHWLLSPEGMAVFLI